jgi:hypothetical protein
VIGVCWAVWRLLALAGIAFKVTVQLSFRGKAACSCWAGKEQEANALLLAWECLPASLPSCLSSQPSHLLSDT